MRQPAPGRQPGWLGALGRGRPNVPGAPQRNAQTTELALRTARWSAGPSKGLKSTVRGAAAGAVRRPSGGSASAASGAGRRGRRRRRRRTSGRGSPGASPRSLSPRGSCRACRRGRTQSDGSGPFRLTRPRRSLSRCRTVVPFHRRRLSTRGGWFGVTGDAPA